jgi:hypothetical protein
MPVATEVQYRSNRGSNFGAVLVLHQLFSVWKLKRAHGQDARTFQPMGELRTNSVIANKNDTPRCEEARCRRRLQPRIGYRTRRDHCDSDSQNLKYERTAGVNLRNFE